MANPPPFPKAHLNWSERNDTQPCQSKAEQATNAEKAFHFEKPSSSPQYPNHSSVTSVSDTTPFHIPSPPFEKALSLTCDHFAYLRPISRRKIPFSSMSTNQQEGYPDDFLEQILAIPSSYAGLPATDASSGQTTATQVGSAAGGGFQQPFIPLGLSLDNGRQDVSGGAFAVKSEREPVNMASLFPAFEHLQTNPVRQVAPQAFHGQLMPSTTVTVPQPPAIRPRVRARRGQATDPHSIAERLRRERIAERMKALQELVPSCNKTDRAAMLDEILDYVKFLRLQVKVLSMSRLGGAGAVAQLVTDIPLPSVEGDNSEGGCNQRAWDKWSDLDIEQEVAKLMEEDVGAAMQYLQSKGLCIMPVSLAALIYPDPADSSTLVKPEPNGQS